MIKAVIFDCGQVLLKYSEDLMIQDIAREFGVASDDIGPLILGECVHPLQRGKISERRFWQDIANRLGEDLPDCYETLWEREFRAQATIREPTYALVDQLKSKGYKVGMLSNTEISHSRVIRDNFPEHKFDAYILSNEHGCRKPEPEIYLLTSRELGVEPQEAVFIDDRIKLVEGAQNVGMKGVHYIYHEQLVQDLKALGVKL